MRTERRRFLKKSARLGAGTLAARFLDESPFTRAANLTPSAPEGKGETSRSAVAQATPATLTVDLSRTLGAIDPRIFGHLPTRTLFFESGVDGHRVGNQRFRVP